eukprot:Awhi_evm2s12309
MVSDINQCITDITWERKSILRALIYVQVSVSGQALIFVTRAKGFSYFSRPGFLLLLAFVFAQVSASLIGGFGLNGYPFPSQQTPCLNCSPNNQEHGAPLYGTNSVDTASVLGCGTWVIVAWVWSLIWYIPLDFIKFLMAFAFNDDCPDIPRWLSCLTNPFRLRSDNIYSRSGASVHPESIAGRRSTGHARPSQV